MISHDGSPLQLNSSSLFVMSMFVFNVTLISLPIKFRKLIYYKTTVIHTYVWNSITPVNLIQAANALASQYVLLMLCNEQA